MQSLGFGLVLGGIFITVIAGAILQSAIRAAPAPEQEKLIDLRRKYLRIWVLVLGLGLYFGAQQLAKQGNAQLMPYAAGLALTVIFGNDIWRQIQLRNDRRALNLPPELAKRCELHTKLRILAAVLLPVGAALYLPR